MTTDDSAADAVFARQGRDRSVDWLAQLRADNALAATADLAPVEMRRAVGGGLVLTWRLAPQRTLVWYATADEDGWGQARVVQQGEPLASHWADVGSFEDLAAILREELGVEEAR